MPKQYIINIISTLYLRNSTHTNTKAHTTHTHTPYRMPMQVSSIIGGSNGNI